METIKERETTEITEDLKRQEHKEKKKIYNPQTKYWHIIIESINKENGEITNLKKLYEYLEYASEYFAEILHNKDIKNNQEKERPHHHIIIIFKTITRKSTILNTFSEILEIPKTMITITKMLNVFLETQYLIHKNDPTKYQYAPFEITTNKPKRLNEILNANTDHQEITATELIEIVYKENNFYKILKVLGLEVTKKYYFIINKLLEEKANINRQEVINNL